MRNMVAGRMFRLALGLVLTPYCLAWAVPVTKTGAKGDGKHLDTVAVQRAIDDCARDGGGTVSFPPGTYLCGSLHLRSNVTLSIEAGAVILGSPHKKDYDPYEKLGFRNASDMETTYFHHALIWGEDVEHVSIVGQGVIDCNHQQRGGPKAIALKRCRFVAIQDVTIKNIPNYTISMLGTDYVNIDGVTILNARADGIDPDSCRNVRIANCHIESVDDAIVPKASFSLGELRPCEYITVTNCYLGTVCYCFKLGTESGGDFRYITVSNCVMTGLDPKRPASGGVALESVDGSHIEGVAVSNISMFNVEAPVFLRLGNRGRDQAAPTPGTLRNVVIGNITASDASYTCSITGIPGHPVEDVMLSDIRVVYKGGGPYIARDGAVPEQIGEYPEADMFAALPGYGLYVRHAAGVTLRNVQLAFAADFWREPMELDKVEGDGAKQKPTQGQAGPALVCDDVSRLRVDALDAMAAPEGDPVCCFINTRDAIVRNSAVREGTKAFLEVSGKDTESVYLMGNVLKGVAHPVSAVNGARADAVTCQGNIE